MAITECDRIPRALRRGAAAERCRLGTLEILGGQGSLAATGWHVWLRGADGAGR
jgi:hypothetical protein